MPGRSGTVVDAGTRAVTYNPHLDQPVSHVGASLGTAGGAVIAMHGRGRDPEDVLALNPRIGVEGLAWLAPAASDNVWYPQGFMSPLEDNEPALGWTMERIDTLVREASGHGITPERIVLLGFSQGACAIAEYAIRNVRRYGGVIILTGGLIGPPGTQWDYGGDFEATPAFIGGSIEDDWVPHDRMLQTRDELRARGADVSEHFYSGSDHIVSDEEAAAARSIMSALL